MENEKEFKDFYVKDGEWTRAHSHLICCDCGLSHKTEFSNTDGKTYLRFFRDEAMTAKNRAKMFGKHATLITEALNSGGKAC
jgi:hypothetical protein